ncbi:uncharacterized protein BDCG_16972 [Blastomyces dermatitidis ER-3]|uniref:Uncharacterized protein n=1 Tax=Ajellomyces dermatitidis (strain ER-3 / ATCC MYA-2586) TaxID=559297 RepID=A0ABX2VVN3_AJEDR|nr:uncharacterized protein BDCG_16972 [Blastomyces dermatitidis ER-3]OAT01208.1 hypothetical protein BDCG_16972 [Blastomyces dermatitidis ER-3]
MIHFQIFLRLGPDETHVKKCMRSDQMKPNVKFMVPAASLVTEEKLQIELFRVTISEIKLSLKFSLNDHIESYITILIKRRGSVTTVMRESENELNTDELTDRRNDISLQDAATTAAAARDAEEGEDVTMRVMLSQLIDITVSVLI